MGSNSLGSIIPDVGDVISYEVTPDLSWVLVVEKEVHNSMDIKY